MPGLYAALHALGVIPTERLLRLRRLGGLDGHPDVGVPGIEANSGSLGMGISKGRGIAWAKRHLGRGGRVVVMVGDGELQEGQNFEALQAAAHQRRRATSGWSSTATSCSRTGRRRRSSRSATSRRSSRAFGWHVEACDGHDHAALRARVRARSAPATRRAAGARRAARSRARASRSWSIPPRSREGGGTYRWHAGAPDDEAFERAHDELVGRIDERLAALGLEPLELEPVPPLDDDAAPALEGEPESGAGARARSA